MAQFGRCRNVREDRKPLWCKCRDWAGFASLPEAHLLGRVVHRAVDVTTDEVFRNIAATFERHVRYLDVELFLQHRCYEAVFLACARAAHLPFATRRFHSGNPIIHRLDVAVRIHPKHKGVERHAGDGREFFDVDADVRAQRCRVVAVQRRHDLVRVARIVLHVTQGFRTRTTALVHRQDRHGGEVFFLNDRLEQSCQTVGTAALTRHDDHFNRFLRLPVFGNCRRGASCDQSDGCDTSKCGTTCEVVDHVNSSQNQESASCSGVCRTRHLGLSE